MEGLMEFLKKEFPNGNKRGQYLVNPKYIFKNYRTGEYRCETLTSGLTSAPGHIFSIVPNFDMTLDALYDYVKTQMERKH